MVQIDVSTEKGVILKDAYIDVKEPWLRTFGLQAGVFNRPFGLEIELSSSVRETPERSYIFPMLFPDERDFGAMLVIRAPEDSPWHIVGLQAGIFSVRTTTTARISSAISPSATSSTTSRSGPAPPTITDSYIRERAPSTR